MNQYHIYEAIGRGKHSTVYKGRKKKTIEYYAIKSVDKSQKSKVLQEVRTLHSLDHPNVLKFYAWYETSAHLWLVLEYCVGGDLLTLLRQDSRLPEESIHDFARDLVQALQFLHSKGVIYCDLKPSNILLDENGRLKLCDFGLARRLSDISKSSVAQLPQAKRGTPCYMAPELFQDGGVHSYASDIWALGCVLYECYAGRPPFVANEFTQLVKSIISDPTPSFRSNPSKEFLDLVSRLLVKDPAERMQWSELREHPFWRTKFRALTLPSQPAFMNLLQLSLKPGASDTREGNTENSLSEKDQGMKNTKQGSHGPHKQNENEAIQTKGPVTPTKDAHNMGRTQNHQIKNSSGISDGQPLKEASARTNAGINILRLSKIVKTNLQRESEGQNYRKPLPKSCGNDSEIKIENNDLELDFAENAEGDVQDENDVPEHSVSASHASEVKTSVQTPSATALCDGKEKEDNNANILSPSPFQDGPGNEQECTKTVQEGTCFEQQEVAATPPGVGFQRRAHRTAGIAAELGKATSGSPAHVDPSKPSATLLQALWHPSDLSVRPIMLSRKNEKASEPSSDARVLPFDTLPPPEFLKLSADQLDAFISRIIASINGNTSLVEKQSTLRYLETLSSNIDVANILTNGPVMSTLVKMLRISKQTAFRVQLVTVIGLFIRHATLIEDEVANSGIISVLTDGLRDKQEKVRRFAMAALGELLFYVSTQSENSSRVPIGQESPAKEGRSSSAWQVPSAVIGLISSILCKGEDDATQLYALKTIENIASQGGDWATRFASREVIGNLCYIFKAPGKQESLRITAGSCLVRLVRFSPPNIQLVLEKLMFKDLVAGLAKGNQKEQQININLLNMALLGSNMINNMGKHLLSLLEEKTLVPNLVLLLEQAAEVLRGKAFVCAALLCKINRRWLPSLCNAKVLPAMERLTKEKDTYVQQCMEALVQIVASVVPGILDSISADIQQLSNGKRTGLVATPHSGRAQSRSSIHLFPVVFHLFSSPVFKQRIVSQQVLQQLAMFMQHLETASFQGRDDFQLTLLRILELVGQESSVLLEFSEIFISQVLPSLAVLYKNNTDGDARFLCLKILFDVLVIFLNDISDCPSNQNDERANNLKSISEKHFLPLYPTLIEDEDPIPMYAQKLLVMLLDLKCIKISDLLQLKLVSQFFEFLLEDLCSTNVNNVRLCLLLASASEVETEILSDLRVVRRVGALLEFVNSKEMEDFLEPTLSLCRSFLIRSTRKGNLGGMLGTPGSHTIRVGSVNDQASAIRDITDFGSYVGVFLELCGNHEARIADLAAECLVLFTSAAPKEAAFNVLSNLPCLGKVLESCYNRRHASNLSQLQWRLLYALCVACKEQRSTQAYAAMPSVSIADRVRIEAVVSNLRSSSIPQIADAALDAVLELQLLPHGS